MAKFQLYHLELPQAIRDNAESWEGFRQTEEWNAYADARCGDGYQAAIDRGFYDYVADVECDSVDDVFGLTNSVTHNWTENEAVSARSDRLRSTSVGDIVRSEDGKLFICDRLGWLTYEGAEPEWVFGKTS